MFQFFNISSCFGRNNTHKAQEVQVTGDQESGPPTAAGSHGAPHFSPGDWGSDTTQPRGGKWMQQEYYMLHWECKKEKLMKTIINS